MPIQLRRGNGKSALAFYGSFHGSQRTNRHLVLLVALVLLLQTSIAAQAWAQAPRPLTPPVPPRVLGWETLRLEELREPAQIQFVKSEPRDERVGFIWIEKMPQFKGGMKALRKFLRDSLRYPFPGAQGRVFVAFLVTETGLVTDARVVKGEHPLLDAEALRVTLSMPPWEPAMSNNRTQAFPYTLPVDFNLEPAGTKRRRR